MQLQIGQRVSGVDPAVFWGELVEIAVWRELVGKYGALSNCARLADGERGAAYKQALLELSARWPGALREGELIGPERVEARRQAAIMGTEARAPARARATWTEEPARAALCWAELHQLIGDQLRYRRARAKPRQAFSWAAYATWLAEAGRRSQWPAVLLREEGLGPKLEVRSAYLCLAARAGLELSQLNALLFARTGHWDHRAEDPSWAHA